MCRAWSGSEFHVNFGSGRVGSLHLLVGLGRVKKIGPTSNFGVTTNLVFNITIFFNVKCLENGTKYILRVN